LQRLLVILFMWVIIGNFSGSAAGLKESFERLGRQVLVVTDGDGFKGYRSSDYYLLPQAIVKRLLAEFIVVYYCFRAKRIVVQDYMPFVRFNFLAYLLFWIALRLKKGVYYVVGDDPQFYSLGPILAPEIDLWERIKLSDQHRRRMRKIDRVLYNVFILSVNRIVGGAFLYELIYKSHNKYVGRCNFITRLGGLGKNNFETIRLFHGIQSQRAKVKGSDLVRSLEDKILVTIDLPFSEYIEAKLESNVVIDQVVGYEPGMNAIESVLSSGQIVLCGYNYRWCKNKTLKGLDVYDKNSLVKAIKKLKSENLDEIFHEMYQYYKSLYSHDRKSLKHEISLFE
jgi:hypothetical protein